KPQETATDRYLERIGDAKKARNIITDETIDLGKLSIPAKSTLVLELLPNVTH
ncbi:cyclomaltodextrinase C-terminal domain-containing protein, partial [Acinetobacter baumannii]